MIRSWLVSGSQYDNEVPGTHEVFSRSEQSSAWNGKAILPLMIRWYPTDIGNLGFHGIPIQRRERSSRTRPPTSWEPACRAAANASTTPTPPSCGSSPPSVRRSSSPDAVSCRTDDRGAPGHARAVGRPRDAVRAERRVLATAGARTGRGAPPNGSDEPPKQRRAELRRQVAEGLRARPPGLRRR